MYYLVSISIGLKANLKANLKDDFYINEFER